MAVEILRPASREEWLRLRERNIGASEVSALLGVHDYKTPYELWALKSGLVTADSADNPAMRRGRLMEPVALQILAEDYPEWTVEPNPIPGGNYYQDTELRLAATPDAFVTIPNRGRGIAQVKSVEPGVFRRDWQPNGNETEVPLAHAVQTICEAHLSGAEWACVVPIVADHGIRIEVLDVPLHAALITRIKAAAVDFWCMIDEGREPPPDYGRDSAIIEQLYQPIPDEVLDLTGSNELPALLDERESLSEIRTATEKRLKEIKGELIANLKDYVAGRVADGRIITAKRIHKKAYEVPATSYVDVRVKAPMSDDEARANARLAHLTGICPKCGDAGWWIDNSGRHWCDCPTGIRVQEEDKGSD
jgi:predicted phage-related endonuclease